MPTRQIISTPTLGDPSGTTGVDMLANPLRLGDRKLHSAVNLRFEEGVIKTRPGFNYQHLGLSGQVQGATRYSPSQGVSARPFGVAQSALAMVVAGKVYIFESTNGELSCGPRPLGGDCDFCDKGKVHLFQAENWLIVQNHLSNTAWWSGDGDLVKSPGMDPTCYEDTDPAGNETYPGQRTCRGDIPPENPQPTETSVVVKPPPNQWPGACDGGQAPPIAGGEEASQIRTHTHDSFCFDKHKNWLINAAGLGAYVHGRIHQYGNRAIFVSDMLHKRGFKMTDDILLMEEQSMPSYGDPLTANSRLGELKALVVLPSMNTPNGEGDLIGYYENGVVAFDTFKSPRQTRVDGKGKIITRGWNTERLINHLLNTVSAVGPNAVAVMPRDHFFRSAYGLHFLKLILGEGSFRTENVNLISQDVQPLLDADYVQDLVGAACGHWVRGNRLFATVGLHEAPCHGALPIGKGFISFNQATTFTEDQTPRPTAEGHWVVDNDMEGVHEFLDLGLTAPTGSYGFLTSDRDAELYFATINERAEADCRDGKTIPIEWSCVTGRFNALGRNVRKKLVSGVLEGTFSAGDSRVRVSVRTDLQPHWSIWEEFEPVRKKSALGQRFSRVLPLGKPTRSHQEATWFQFKIEGLGYAEITNFSMEVVEAGEKSGQVKSVAVGLPEDDFFEINNHPSSARWK